MQLFNAIAKYDDESIKIKDDFLMEFSTVICEY